MVDRRKNEMTFGTHTQQALTGGEFQIRICSFVFFRLVNVSEPVFRFLDRFQFSFFAGLLMVVAFFRAALFFFAFFPMFHGKSDLSKVLNLRNHFMAIISGLQIPDIPSFAMIDHSAAGKNGIVCVQMRPDGWLQL